MHSADTAGTLTAVHPMEALLLRKTMQLKAKIAEWKLLCSVTIAPEAEASRFEPDACEVTEQLLAPFFKS
jgi:hypothetical protein